MAPKIYQSWATARRAAGQHQPILRILNDAADFEAYIVLPNMSTDLMALDPRTGAADGTISFLDLSCKGQAS